MKWISHVHQKKAGKERKKQTRRFDLRPPWKTIKTDVNKNPNGSEED
jgi:hypothetical protein